MALKGKNELERFTDKCGYNNIWAALKEWIKDSSDKLEIDGNDIILDDIDIKFTRNLQVDGCCFTYDAVIEADIAYTDLYRELQSKSQWFMMRCAAEVDDTLKLFEVSNVKIYEKIPTLKSNVTDNFVPVISKAQMDDEARAFLRKYCPKALLEPTKVPIREIAAEMGLELKFGYILSEDFSYFGQISFSDTKTRVYDLESGKSRELDVTRGTVLIDPEVFWERSLGCEDFTITHEVVHWEKHRLFADIKRLLHRNYYNAHRCPKPTYIHWNSDSTWSDEEWLEWHANGIGARILMPKETVAAKIKELKENFSYELLIDKTEFFVVLIDELATFYGTSRLTAKYRLKELGYKAVENIQLHEYDYQAYTHEIDEYKAFYEICESPELHMLVSMGMFAYADRHFVINHEKCVSVDEDGIPHLTDFAWANLEKCTIKFSNVRINIKESNRLFSDILYRGKTYETFQKYNSNDNEAAFEFARELAADYQVKAPEREKLNITFSQRVRQIIEAKNINEMRFQERTKLSKATFYRLQSEKDKQSFDTILAFCAGLDLDIFLTQELLGKAGLSFNGGMAHNAYMLAITQFPGKSIDVRNEFLSNLDIKGVKPLGEDLSK
ncbi:MAG: helix-turn-helix transcriptional regulator [Oscillospiraceae bacterium]|nr:helix-turn-helix transcriptional regulator [Oscillospiraceae bacterium]